MALSLKTERFKVDVPSHEIKRLKEKVRNTRLPSNPIVPEAGEDYGPPIEWFQRLHQTWTVDFDWESVQQHLNRHEHFLGNIKDEEHNLKLHFVHVRSSRPNAIPLLLVHGWPGSFYEFDRVIDLLSEPKDANVQAFHVVVPSLPGFCWSSAPPRRGWTLKDNARVFNNLMLGLGYLSYGVQAGDWGSFVARELGAQYPACKAVHLNFCPVPLHTPDNELSPREKLVKKRYDDWLDDHLGYAVCMRTRPHTIGVALIDNPVGIMSWVGEKYYEAAAPQKATDPEWDQAILIQSSLYYFTDCIMTSMLPYYENVKHAEFGSYFTRPENRIDVPFAYSSFLYDTRPGTERTVKETGNMVQYREFDNGGHFAALECPESMAQDCHEFFGRWFKA